MPVVRELAPGGVCGVIYTETADGAVWVGSGAGRGPVELSIDSSRRRRRDLLWP